MIGGYTRDGYCLVILSMNDGVLFEWYFSRYSTIKVLRSPRVCNAFMKWLPGFVVRTVVLESEIV